MNMISMIGVRGCDAQVDAIRAEFGAVMSARILDAEAAEFMWESRVSERYLGQQIDILIDDDEASEDVSRMAFLSDFDGNWHAGICLVNGNGDAVELVWKRRFGRNFEAQMSFDRAS